jgi:hypothetical protein
LNEGRPDPAIERAAEQPVLDDELAAAVGRDDDGAVA